MDKFNLRIIANPFLLKQHKKLKDNNQSERENNDLLYRFLEYKYKSIYITPKLYYDIINIIDEGVKDYEINQIVEEIVDSSINSAINIANYENNQ